MSKVCKDCEGDILPGKRWGYATLCAECDTPETTNRSMGIVIADGKTDYYVEVVRNPSDRDVEAIKAIGKAWDPRSQLKAINKVSS